MQEAVIANSISLSADKKDAVARRANSHFAAWEQRTALVKQQAIAESAANDAKTARLRALRLEKERQDAEAALAAPLAVKASPRIAAKAKTTIKTATKPAAPAKKRAKR